LEVASLAFGVVPLRDGNQLLTDRRVRESVDPRVEAAPIDRARQICAKLREGHFLNSCFVPRIVGASCVLVILWAGDCPSIRTL
jgi:hypothetical protein